jgi:hypothetical protein
MKTSKISKIKIFTYIHADQIITKTRRKKKISEKIKNKNTTSAQSFREFLFYYMFI